MCCQLYMISWRRNLCSSWRCWVFLVPWVMLHVHWLPPQSGWMRCVQNDNLIARLLSAHLKSDPGLCWCQNSAWHHCWLPPLCYWILWDYQPICTPHLPLCTFACAPVINCLETVQPTDPLSGKGGHWDGCLMGFMHSKCWDYRKCFPCCLVPMWSIHCSWFWEHNRSPGFKHPRESVCPQAS